MQLDKNYKQLVNLKYHNQDKLLQFNWINKKLEKN